MYARNSKHAFENGASSPSNLAAWSPARVPFAELTGATAKVGNGRTSQRMIAVGAVSVVAVTAAVLSIDFSGSESDIVAVSSGSEGSATEVRPSIDFGPGPSEETLLAAKTADLTETATERMESSSSRIQTPRLAGAAGNAQAPSSPIKVMPARTKARDEPKDPLPPSPAGLSAKDERVTSFAPERPFLTGSTRPAPELKAGNKAPERLAVQSHGLAGGETAAGASFMPAEQTQAGSVRLTTAGAGPGLQPTQLRDHGKASDLHPVITSGLPSTGELIADDLVARGPVPSDLPVDEVLLLDVESAVASTAPLLAATGARAVEEAEVLPPGEAAQAISHSGGIGSAPIEDVSPFEAPQKIRAGEENARQFVSREASGASNGSSSPAGAVAPVAELAAAVQDRSEVRAAMASHGQDAQGSSAEVLSGTVATQARASGTAVGSLPLQISTNALVSVRLADLISLFEDRMDRPLFVWLKSSSSADEFVTFDTLRSAGIDAQYDAGTQQVALSITHDQTP